MFGLLSSLFLLDSLIVLSNFAKFQPSTTSNSSSEFQTRLVVEVTITGKIPIGRERRAHCAGPRGNVELDIRWGAQSVWWTRIHAITRWKEWCGFRARVLMEGTMHPSWCCVVIG
ncbi:unnamed protein product [Lupinus luteus]|uniref:Secreted protein n=1 Tax=Lupinus luteus TaxID=3873 RepID=A0AAV1WP19_LUPLU